MSCLQCNRTFDSDSSCGCVGRKYFSGRCSRSFRSRARNDAPVRNRLVYYLPRTRKLRDEGPNWRAVCIKHAMIHVCHRVFCAYSSNFFVLRNSSVCVGPKSPHQTASAMLLLCPVIRYQVNPTAAFVSFWKSHFYRLVINLLAYFE